MLDSRGGLAVATLVFYLPVLFIAAFVAFKHGFGRSSGWIFLVILSLIRIVGSVCGIIAELQPSETVIVIFDILAAVGLSPLLLAMIGMLKRLQEGMVNRPMDPRIFNLLGVLPVVGLILSIIAGTDLQDTSKPDDMQTGITLSHVSSILFLVTFILSAAVAALTATKVGSIIKGDKRILVAVLIALPFLLVRVIYLMLTSFNLGNPGTQFSVISGSVIIEAFMATLEEFVVVILFLVAGFLAPKISRAEVQSGNYFTANTSLPTQTPLQGYPRHDVEQQHQGVVYGK